jgi:hypothetical protein
VGSTGDWSTDTPLAAYDTKRHAFTWDLKPSNLDMSSGTVDPDPVDASMSVLADHLADRQSMSSRS